MSQFRNFYCTTCGANYRVWGFPSPCVICGGSLAQIQHPMQAGGGYNRSPIGGGWPDLENSPKFAEWKIQQEFERGMAAIEARLAAEVEMDKYDAMCYDVEKDKGDHDGKEEDNADSVSLREDRPVEGVRTEPGSISSGSVRPACPHRESRRRSED